MNNTSGFRLLSMLIKAQQIADVSDDDALFLPRQTMLVPSPPATTSTNTNYSITQADPEKPKQWKKPKDMPRRPLSAYNLFFKSERQIMVSSSSVTNKKIPPAAAKGTKRGKSLGIGFAGMARTIAGKWKIIPGTDKSIFEAQARIEKARYLKEVAVWRMNQATKKVALKDATLKRKQEASSTTVALNNSLKGRNDDTPFKQYIFDASETSCQSLDELIKNIQDKISHGQKQLYNIHPHTASESINPIPIQSCSSTRSLLQPFDLSASSKHICEENQRRPNAGDSSTYDEPVPASCWKGLASLSTPTSSDHHLPSYSSSEKVTEGSDLIDDLSVFMNIMEAADW